MEKEQLIEYLEKYPDLSSKELARLIFSQKGQFSTVDTLSRRIRKIRQANSSLTVETKKEEEPYVVADGYYKWIVNKDRFIKMSVEVIDQLFYEYSIHGEDLSQTEIINRHNLERWQWNSIKRKLDLVKLSNIFSPYTVEITPPDELEAMIEEKIQAKFENKGALVERLYKKVQTKEYNKVINQDASQKFVAETLYLDLIDRFPVPEKVILQEVNYLKGINELVVGIADLHVGAKVEGMDFTRDYDVEQVRKSLSDIAYLVNAEKAKKVHVKVLGDLIESYTGLNHKNSWKQMQYGMWGNQVVITAFELLEDFFSQLINLASVDGVSGNHDRATSDNKEDTTGEIASNIFYFLKRLYADAIEINYKYNYVYAEHEGIGYVSTHNHLKGTQKSTGNDIILNYGNNRIFNVIMSGHFHQRDIKADTHRFRWLGCPPVFPGNHYSQDLSFSALPGVKMVHNNGKGLPKEIDYTI